MKHACHHDQLVALRRIEGQIRGVQKMIEEGKYCIDILNQVHAVVGSLVRVEDNILEKHLNQCVSETVNAKKGAELKLKEVMDIVRKYRKGYR